jgi:hypothetical protein
MTKPKKRQKLRSPEERRKEFFSIEISDNNQDHATYTQNQGNYFTLLDHWESLCIHFKGLLADICFLQSIDWIYQCISF